MDIFDSLKGLVNVHKVCIDNNVFRLHYRLTFIILVGCSVLVSARQYIGDPIVCIPSDDSIADIMNTYCWIHSTYTIAKRIEGKIVYKDAGEMELLEYKEAHPGIHSFRYQDTVSYQTYYQWVWIVLFLQAVIFYLPHWLWKTFEGGRIKTLVSDLLNAHAIAADKKSEKKRQILEYFVPNKGHHTAYGLQFFLCEFLNFINVVVQIFITDSFLGNEFTKYGLEVLKFTQKKPYSRNDAMARVFPTVSACALNRYGPSGKIVTHDAICVLPINILNEKIYIFLWFWFIGLATLSALAVIFRVLVSFVRRLRIYQIKRRCRSVDIEILELLSDNYGFGDWFLLLQIGRNMNPITFGELLKDMACSLSMKDSSMKGMNPSATFS